MRNSGAGGRPRSEARLARTESVPTAFLRSQWRTAGVSGLCHIYGEVACGPKLVDGCCSIDSVGWVAWVLRCVIRDTAVQEVVPVVFDKGVKFASFSLLSAQVRNRPAVHDCGSGNPVQSLDSGKCVRRDPEPRALFPRWYSSRGQIILSFDNSFAVL